VLLQGLLGKLDLLLVEQILLPSLLMQWRGWCLLGEIGAEGGVGCGVEVLGVPGAVEPVPEGSYGLSVLRVRREPPVL